MTLICFVVFSLCFHYYQIIVLISATSMLKYVPAYFEEHYKNVIFARVNITGLLSNTPGSKIWSPRTMIDGHDDKGIGDVLRIVLLFRFGGIFFNSDVISVRPVPNKHQVQTIPLTRNAFGPAKLFHVSENT